MMTKIEVDFGQNKQDLNKKKLKIKRGDKSPTNFNLKNKKTDEKNVVFRHKGEMKRGRELGGGERVGGEVRQKVSGCWGGGGGGGGLGAVGGAERGGGGGVQSDEMKGGEMKSLKKDEAEERAEHT